MMTTFIYPTVARVTSNFRTKERPSHHGVDFAQTGNHEIKATSDGVVSRSYSSPSYGEVVFIVHTDINGQIWETVYAHMRVASRTVRVGSKVKQGQVIGIMGNTGDSSGQHLHFELHKGYWNINKSNAVNPLDYLGTAISKFSSLIYVVKKGDTLSHIAVKYNTTVKDILKLNPEIKNANLIQIGQSIKVK